MQHFHCMHMLLCSVYVIEWLCMTSYFLSRLTSMQVAKLYFCEFCEKIYCHENIIVNILVLIVGYLHQLAFRKNLNANNLF